MTLDLNLYMYHENGMCFLLFDPRESEKQICLRTSKRQVWGCDAWLKTDAQSYLKFMFLHEFAFRIAYFDEICVLQVNEV